MMCIISFATGPVHTCKCTMEEFRFRLVCRTTCIFFYEIFNSLSNMIWFTVTYVMKHKDCCWSELTYRWSTCLFSTHSTNPMANWLR